MVILKVKKTRRYLLFSDSVNKKYDNFLGHFLHGIKLKSYVLTNIKLKRKKIYFNSCYRK